MFNCLHLFHLTTSVGMICFKTAGSRWLTCTKRDAPSLLLCWMERYMPLVDNVGMTIKRVWNNTAQLQTPGGKFGRDVHFIEETVVQYMQYKGKVLQRLDVANICMFCRQRPRHKIRCSGKFCREIQHCQKDGI